MQENGKRILYVFGAAVSGLLLIAPNCVQAASPPQTATQPQVLSNAVANDPVRFDVSPPLTALLAGAPAQQTVVHQTHAPLKPKRQLSGAQLSQGIKAASAFHPSIGSLVSATPRLGFEGVGQVGGFYGTPEGLNCGPLAGGFSVPPDTIAAVGDTQVV